MLNSAYLKAKGPDSYCTNPALSSLVKLWRAPDVDKSLAHSTTSSTSQTKPVTLSGRITAAFKAFWPLLWDRELAERQGEAGNAITISPVPDRLRYSMSRGSATSQLAWDACGYPNFTTQHMT